MAQPSSRQTLIDYCKRQLGYPVLEVNVADEQIDDLVDDAIQYFQERHFDGVFPTLLKYKFTQEDIDRGKASNSVGVASTSTTELISGSSVQFDYEENSNYLKVPDDIIGITKVFQFEGSNSVSSGMFGLKYQLFLNDIYFWGSTELLTYSMTKTYLEDIDFLLSTQKQIRFNQRMNRLYLDIDWSSVNANKYLIIDCYRGMNPDTHTRVWNDSFLKKYLTSLIKKQWGQNMIKFQGMKLPGGVELNGRQMYDDAEKELEIIREQMSNTYELPPFDMIG
jgi:hypothetical protein|tara:strand:+ start:68 stop:904 length:837 start_codon:yes stop_codon:yes gene_type:complete